MGKALKDYSVDEQKVIFGINGIFVGMLLIQGLHFSPNGWLNFLFIFAVNLVAVKLSEFTNSGLQYFILHLVFIVCFACIDFRYEQFL